MRGGRAAAPAAVKQRPVWAAHGEEDDGGVVPTGAAPVAAPLPQSQHLAPQSSSSSAAVSGSRPTYTAADIVALANAQPATAMLSVTKPTHDELAASVPIDGAEDDLSEDVLARKAAAARAHREQQRKRNAFGSLLVSGSGGVSSSRGAGTGGGAGAGAGVGRGGTSIGSLSRGAAADAAAGGYDYDSYSDERVSLPAGAADVAALRSALGRGQTRPVGTSSGTSGTSGSGGGVGGGRSLALHMDADADDDAGGSSALFQARAAPAAGGSGLRRLGAAPVAAQPFTSGLARAPSDSIPAWEAEQLRRAMGGSAAAADAERRAAQTARDLAVLRSATAAVASASGSHAYAGMAVDEANEETVNTHASVRAEVQTQGGAGVTTAPLASAAGTTAPAAGSRGGRGAGLGGSSGGHAFPILPDPSAELDSLLRSSAGATARLQEAADSSSAAASAAAAEKARTAAAAAALQTQLSGAAIAYDSYVDLQKTLSAAVAVLRERAPLLQDLMRATVMALGRLTAARAARRRTDVVDLLAEAAEAADAADAGASDAAASGRTCLCASVGCGDGNTGSLAAAAAAVRTTAAATAAAPTGVEARSVSALMTKLGISIAQSVATSSLPAAAVALSPPALAAAADVTVAATADEVTAALSSAPSEIRAERRFSRITRVRAALQSMRNDVCAGRCATLLPPLASAAGLWDEYDAPDSLDRGLAAACLQPLAAAHSILFADPRAAGAASVDALLQPFTQWKRGRVARKLAAPENDAASASAAAVPAAVAASVSAAYVRTFSYLAIQGLCEPLVTHGAWPWLLGALAGPHLHPPTSASAAAGLAVAGAIDSLPWFAPLWHFGEVPLAAASAAAMTGATSASSGTKASDSDGESASDATPSTAAAAASAALSPAAPSAEVAAAAASDESLLPRLVASALLPAALKLIPVAADPLVSAATSRIAGNGGLLSELHLYDLPADAGPAIASAAAAALTQGCRSLIVPLLLERPAPATSSPAPTAAATGGSGWTVLGADEASGLASGADLRAARPAPLTLLYVGCALRALHSLVAWREAQAVPEPTLQHLALGTVIASALRPLLDACLLGILAETSTDGVSAPGSSASGRPAAAVRLLVGPSARGSAADPLSAAGRQQQRQQQPSAALIHLGGTVLASIAQLLPSKWLHSVLPAITADGAADSAAASAAEGLTCLRQWAGAARAAPDASTAAWQGALSVLEGL